MMRLKISVPAFCVSLLFSLASESVLAQWQDGESPGRFSEFSQLQPVQDLPTSTDGQPGQNDEPGQSGDSHGRFYGIGQPKTTQDLPPGHLRNTLEGLPPKARGKALGWLREFSFPVEDVKSLRVNSDGAIYYADTFLPAPEEAASTESLVIEAAMDASQIFRLHSRPGSSNVVYLDFDGQTMEGTAWNLYSEPVLVALPFDPSQNDNPPTQANFTQDELNRIAEIWHRMSEDYAAFDIDVTTEEPAVFTSTTGHVLFTHDVDANGVDMPSKNAGGVAYVNAFGRSDYVRTYSPALVYYTNLYTNSHGSATLNAEAGSHEFGHNIGLSHDGIIDGSNYYSGHGSGLVDWAPIMGTSYSRNVTQWSTGEYANANNTQDDLDIIAGDLGYVDDDHGDSAAQATPLVVEANGDILVSSPELDPDNVLTENKGVISDRSDVDWFYLDVADGSLSITATPGWHSFTRSDLRGSNLDIEMALFDSNLTLLELADPDDDTSATITTSLTAGRYYIQVDGIGNTANSNYSDYASMGMYFLEGSVQVGAVEDTTAPSPATMAWQTTPHATGENSFSMTAVQATDDSGSVEYYFSCVAGGNGCTDSGWQASQTWSLVGLDADTYYSYKVTARDSSGNETVASSTMGDTTDAPPPPPAENVAPVAVASTSPDPALITRGKTAEVTMDGSGSSDQDGTIVSWLWKDADGATVSNSMAFTSKLKEGTYEFTLTVTDDDGATDSTSLSVSVSKAPDDGGGGGRKPKPPKGG